jgi:exopolyphosphatase/guanosine-5'-triphosphate,3'-diphosphate pyrophosphatase
MPTFAAVDIGANSVRLKIARFVKRRMEVLHEDREVVRLGASVFSTGLLSPPAMAQTVKVLQRFHKAAILHGCDHVRVAATSALRDARNGQALVDWVRSALGWRIEVISGLEEGRLIHFGVFSNSRLSATRVLMVDLGGGSCELTVSEDGHIRQMFSLPLGAVRLTEEFLHNDPPQLQEVDRLREYIAEEINRVAPRIRGAKVELMIGTSGTAASLAAASGAGSGAAQTATRAGVETLARSLSLETRGQRQVRKGIGPRRSEIIVAGAWVFAELMSRCGLDGYRYSPLGLRDGLLAQMAAEFDSGTRQGKQIESDRRDALVAVARRFHADLPFAQHVRQLAVELFQGLKRVHGLPPEYEEWLGAAAMLHEIGAYINRSGRHRHTRYLIANSEIFGYTPQQRLLIATIARYMGRSRPDAGSRVMKALPGAERGHVVKAVALLRLARALNLGHRAAVQKIAVRLREGRVDLRLTARTGIELELWAVEKERAMFREVFGRELAATVKAAGK